MHNAHLHLISQRQQFLRHFAQASRANQHISALRLFFIEKEQTGNCGIEQKLAHALGMQVNGLHLEHPHLTGEADQRSEVGTVTGQAPLRNDEPAIGQTVYCSALYGEACN